jgi:hypothetical protein
VSPENPTPDIAATEAKLIASLDRDFPMANPDAPEFHPVAPDEAGVLHENEVVAFNHEASYGERAVSNVESSLTRDFPIEKPDESHPEAPDNLRFLSDKRRDKNAARTVEERNAATDEELFTLEPPPGPKPVERTRVDRAFDWATKTKTGRRVTTAAVIAGFGGAGASDMAGERQTTRQPEDAKRELASAPQSEQSTDR